MPISLMFTSSRAAVGRWFSIPVVVCVAVVVSGCAQNAAVVSVADSQLDAGVETTRSVPKTFQSSTPFNAEVDANDSATASATATTSVTTRNASTGFRQSGIASYYGNRFHGRRTASGERYDMHALTAAHRTLPLGACVRVTSPGNGRSVVVRINDRGPFVRGRVIDLSHAAADALGMRAAGNAPVTLEGLAQGREAFEARIC